jgi:hypothetical protein
MRRTLPAMACVVALSITLMTTAEESKQTPGSGIPAMEFLEVGRSYVIHFIHAPPEFKWNGDMKRKAEGNNDETIRIVIPDTLEVFKVVKRPSSSWVLLEFPESDEAYYDWSMGQLFVAEYAQLENERESSNKDSAPTLREAKLTWEAKLKNIKTTQKWVNLDHALTIAPMPRWSHPIKTPF